MEEQSAELTLIPPAAHREDAAAAPLAWALGGLILLGLVAALVTYKVSGSLGTIAKAQASHTLAPRAQWLNADGRPALVRPLVRTANYLAVVWPALVFGVLIAGAVRAVIPASWVAGVFGGSALRAQLFGGLAGAPLMLCSCCIAPVFAAVQRRTRQTGPASALLLASPCLNPAAIALTFLLFRTEIALVRLVAAAALVFGVTALTARLSSSPDRPIEGCSLDAIGAGPLDVMRSFFREVGRTARTTLPALVLGIVLSSLLIEVVPLDRLREAPMRVLAVLLVALVSVPLALPTFAEIPLALGLLAAGAPTGAAVALMIAGPAVNLPSLLTVARTTSRLHAAALGGGAFLAAAAAGLLV